MLYKAIHHESITELDVLHSAAAQSIALQLYSCSVVLRSKVSQGGLPFSKHTALTSSIPFEGGQHNIDTETHTICKPNRSKKWTRRSLRDTTHRETEQEK